MRILLFAYSLFILANPATVYSQKLPVNLRFGKFTTENGLSDNFINHLIKDKNGYLWIATQNGLNRFDGVEFKTFYNNTANSNSLLNNYVGFLAEDSMGRIWAATGSGLSMYNPANGKFINFIPSKNKYITSRVYKVLKAADGSIWFTTRNHLSTVDLKTLRITSWPIDKSSLHPGEMAINDFSEDHNGDFWFNSYLGLSLFDRQTHQIKVMDKNWGLSSLYDNGNGECWMGCWFHGFRNYNFTTGKFTDYFFERKGDSVITRNIESIVHVDYPGLESFLWLGTDNELALFDTQSKRFVKNYTHHAELPTSLPPGRIMKILYDRGNEIWFATEHGLYYARLNQLAFQTYIFPDLQISEISRIREDIYDADFLRISLYPGGIIRLNKATGEITERYMPEEKMEYGFNYLEDFVQEKNGVFWMANHDGLAKYDPITKHFQMLNKPEISFGREDSVIYSLILNPDSTIWFASVQGLGKYTIKTNSFQFYRHITNEGEAKSKNLMIQSIIKDYNNNLWIAAGYDGLQEFDTKTETFKKITVDTTDKANPFCVQVIQSPDSTIWYTNGCKVFFRRKNQTAFTDLVVERNNASIYKLACDHNSNLFMATQSGLIKFEKATGRFTRFTTTDGLYDNRLNRGFDTGSNGELYLRGNGYITLIDPGALNKKYLPSSLVFESMMIGNNDTVIDFKHFSKEPFSLSYSQNQFSVKFRLLHFEDAQFVNYSYKLEGWDKDWISSGTGNYISYSNLDGGDYVLHVKAFQPDGTENPQQAELMIHIDSPFWETVWFRLLVLLCMAGIIYFIYRLRIQRLLAVQQIRLQISRDLHDEIGASLSSVHIMSVFAEESSESKSPDTSRWLMRIGDNTKETIDKIRDIVWTLNSSTEASGKLITRMNQFISHSLEPKDIECEFNADERVDELLNDFTIKRNVYLIFKEAVNNAAKYSECTKVTIVLKADKKKMELTISDNGKGFEINTITSGNGLNNMHLRALQIKATFSIQSLPGKGTIVSLLLPLPHLRYWFMNRST